MKTFTFSVLVDGDLKEITLNASDITEFGIQCYPLYRKKDSLFKKWFKSGFIIANETRFTCSYFFIADLKDYFKKESIKIITTKYTLSENKYDSTGYYRGQRKATNWYYELKR